MPLPAAPPGLSVNGATQDLDLGTPIRIIREPYFGRLARVAALPPEPQTVPSGAVVRVLEAELAGSGVVVECCPGLLLVYRHERTLRPADLGAFCRTIIAALSE